MPTGFVSRLTAVVVVFALAIQFVKGFEFLCIFGNILNFPSVKALSSSSAVFVNVKDVTLELFDISNACLQLCLQRSELVCVVL